MRTPRFRDKPKAREESSIARENLDSCRYNCLLTLKMLSIQTSSKPAKCNLLPCQIKYTGPTDATEKHWVVTEGSGEDGNIVLGEASYVYVLCADSLLFVQNQNRHLSEGGSWLGNLFRCLKATRVLPILFELQRYLLTFHEQATFSKLQRRGYSPKTKVQHHRSLKRNWM
jgi:hypothetical protein